MRIGLFGGVFDPPHVGHLNIAQRAAENLRLDCVYWIPAHLPPHKELDAISPPARTRARMVEAAIVDNPRFTVLDCEIARGGTSYSIDTIREVRRMHPDAEIFFIIGSDALALVPTWREASNVIASVTFAVYARRDVLISDNSAVQIEGPLIDVSSSEIRDRLYRCRGVRYLIVDSVLKIIEDEILYIAEMPQALRQHVRSVEEAAAALAERWDLSRNILSKAARYHDAYRTTPFELAEAILRERGETIDADETASPILLHGRVAAARMEANQLDSGVDRTDGMDCVNAVRYHTTGRAGMSAIEETLFVADRIEKDWAHVDAVPNERRTAVADALESKLARLGDRGLKPHPRMFEAARFYGVVC